MKNKKSSQWAHYQKEFTNNGIVHAQVFFIPAITIDCTPPYVKGKKDSCWIKHLPGKEPKTKEQFESVLGMSILPYKE